MKKYNNPIFHNENYIKLFAEESAEEIFKQFCIDNFWAHVKIREQKLFERVLKNFC